MPKLTKRANRIIENLRLRNQTNIFAYIVNRAAPL